MPWWVWLIIALVLGITEVLSTTFVLMWIAIGGVITAVMALFVPDLWLQTGIFAVASAALLVITRPSVRKWRGVQTIPTPADRMVGKIGLVVTAPQQEQLGTIRIQGELWSVSSNETLTRGMEVVVVKADSSVLVVNGVQK